MSFRVGRLAPVLASGILPLAALAAPPTASVSAPAWAPEDGVVGQYLIAPVELSVDYQATLPPVCTAKPGGPPVEEVTQTVDKAFGATTASDAGHLSPAVPGSVASATIGETTLTVWVEADLGTDKSTLRARIEAADGGVAADWDLKSGFSGAIFNPDVGVYGGTSFVVVFAAQQGLNLTSATRDGDSGKDSDIWIAVVAPDGAVTYPPTGFTFDYPDESWAGLGIQILKHRSHPTVGGMTNKSFIAVAWDTSYSKAGSSEDKGFGLINPATALPYNSYGIDSVAPGAVEVQTFSMLGQTPQLFKDPYRANDWTDGAQRRPVAAGLADTIVIAWESGCGADDDCKSQKLDAAGFGIFWQAFDENGAAQMGGGDQFAGDPLNSGFDQLNPSLSVTGDGTVLLSWTDAGPGNLGSVAISEAGGGTPTSAAQCPGDGAMGQVPLDADRIACVGADEDGTLRWGVVSATGQALMEPQTIGGSATAVLSAYATDTQLVALIAHAGGPKVHRINTSGTGTCAFQLKCDSDGQDIDAGFVLKQGITDAFDVDSAPVKLTCEKSPPTDASIKAPEGYVTATSFTLEYNVGSDAQSGIASATLKHKQLPLVAGTCGGATDPCALDAHKLYTQTLKAGATKDQVLVFDTDTTCMVATLDVANQAGLNKCFDNATVVIKVDAKAPQPALDPVDGGYKLLGNDANLDTGALTMRVDSGVWVSVKDGEVFSTKTLADGSHLIVLKAADLAGNVAEQGLPITIDTQPLEVTITSPVHGSTVGNTPAPKLLFAVSEPIDSVAWTLDGAAQSGNPQSALLAGLAAGAHSVVVSAVSQTGEQASAESTFTVVSGAPAIVIVQPQPATVGCQTPDVDVVLAGSPQDGLYFYGLDGGPGATWKAGESVLDFADDHEGTHTLSAGVVHPGGAMAQSSLTFCVDGKPPSLAIVEPAADSVHTTTAVALGVTLDEAFPDTLTVALRDNETGEVVHEATAMTGENALLNALFPTLGDGTYDVVVVATDTAGHETTAAVTAVTIDASNPVVTITSPAYQAYPSQTIPIAYDVSEPVEDVVIKLNGETLPPMTASLEGAIIGPGFHELEITVTQAAKTGKAVTTFLVAEVSVNSPTDGELVYGNQIELDVFGSEDVLDLTYQLDG